VTIHSEHPFLEAPEDRDAARRFRARLGGAVSLWTAGSGDGRRDRAGLTVSSVMVAPGDPAEVIGLLHPDSDLLDMLVDRRVAVVQLLGAHREQLADAFAGAAPAPGGPFTLATWEQTDWGPKITEARVWAGVRLKTEPVESGWSLLVRCTIEHVEVVDHELLSHVRGRYAVL